MILCGKNYPEQAGVIQWGFTLHICSFCSITLGWDVSDLKGWTVISENYFLCDADRSGQTIIHSNGPSF